MALRSEPPPPLSPLPPPISLDERRRAQRALPRPRTENLQRATKRHLELLRAETPEGPVEHPKTRGECKDGPRPCPLVGCKYHLYAEVSRTGNLRYNFPELAPEDMPEGESCALDIADRGAHTLDEVGRLLRVTRERVRQLEAKALKKLSATRDVKFRELADKTR